MTPLEKAGDGSVTHEVFNALVDAVEAGGGGGTPAGSDGEIQFNDSNAFGASPDFVLDGTPGEPILRLSALENGNAEITGGALGVQLQLSGADGDATHVGGEIVITAGNSAGFDGGDIVISAGGDSGGGTGGDVTIDSGSSTGGDSWDGGDIAIRTNPTETAGHRGGDINVVAGQGTTNGGSLLFQAGGGATNGSVSLGSGNEYLLLDGNGVHVLGTKIGFYNKAPIAQQTGVAVDAAAIHAALVALGLFTA